MKSREGMHRNVWVGGAVVAAAGSFLFGGCGLIMGENLDGMKIAVTNNTDQDLIVGTGGTPFGHVDAGLTATVELSNVECTKHATAITEDKSLAVPHPGEVCEGDIWVIEQGDLRPYDEVFPGDG